MLLSKIINIIDFGIISFYIVNLSIGFRYIMSVDNPKKNGKTILAILIVLAMLSAVLVVGVVVSQAKLTTKASTSGDLKFSGAAVVFPTVKELLGPFNADYPTITTSLNGTETTSNTRDGISDLIAGRANVAMASSVPTGDQYASAAQNGKTLFLTVVAYDSICIIVNPSNPIAQLTLAQIKGIFFDGTITDWSQITNGSKTGAIHVYALEAKTGTGSFFNKVVNDGASNNVNGTVLIDNAALITGTVINDTEGIAYSASGYVGSVAKSLVVNGIAPTQTSVLDGSYAFGRKLYLITDNAPVGAALVFMNFMLSQEGQDIVESTGLVRLI